MVGWVAWLIVATSVLTAIWGVVETVRGIRPTGYLLAVVALLWGGLLLQATGGTIAQFTADPAPDALLFLGYHLTAVTLLPAAALWGIADHSRWGNAVLAFGCGTEAVLVLRMVQIWHDRV
ncbi:MAG: hypothetical protein CSA58_11030 [Micrococcales bacterium]|nr:MAG: hypothetical protein CSA58_11030 [Micrococcales bacterium]